MAQTSDKLLLWSPRVLGILMCLFLSAFALDAFGEGKTFVQALPDFAIHVAPMLVLLAVVGLSWRRAWVGGMVFTGLAVAYAVSVPTHPQWIVVISGPLLLVGLLFLWSWSHHRAQRTKTA